MLHRKIKTEHYNIVEVTLCNYKPEGGMLRHISLDQLFWSGGGAPLSNNENMRHRSVTAHITLWAGQMKKCGQMTE